MDDEREFTERVLDGDLDAFDYNTDDAYGPENQTRAAPDLPEYLSDDAASKLFNAGSLISAGLAGYYATNPTGYHALDQAMMVGAGLTAVACTYAGRTAQRNADTEYDSE